MASNIGRRPDLIAGRYKVLERLGAGGFGSVYKAEDTNLGRVVAVKVISSDKAESEEHRERFKREARLVAGLTHPSIIAVYDYGDQGEVRFATGFTDMLPFIVMEFVDGLDLRQLAKQGLDTSRSVSLVLDVLGALGAAHEHGILHRDVKPENIMVPVKGPAKVVDFGIAKAQDATSITMSGVLGTLLYASPEQLRDNRNLDVRTDLYSVGCVLYRLLTGNPPFPGSDPGMVLFARTNLPVRPPIELNSDLPRPLSDVVVRALEKDPVDRFQTADEFAEALRDAVPEPVSVEKIVETDSSSDRKSPLPVFLPKRKGQRPELVDLTVPWAPPSRRDRLSFGEVAVGPRLLWSKTFGGTGDDAFNAVVGTADGGFIAVGYTRSTDGDLPPSRGREDALLVR
ncbi:MAG: serine/threonine protein kinase, partial [Bifidobacteriaceae bacterium]|nr:serine/threonine protein kinase [Bifidobacteriaceae bacterium]